MNYSKDKTKIFFVYQDLYRGGAENVLVSTLKGMDRNRYKIKVCCMGEIGLAGNELRDIGIDIFCLKRKYKLFNLFTTIALYQIIKKYRPDIVHTSLFYANFHGRLAAKLAGVKAIVSEEQNVYKWKDDNFIFRLINKILSCFTSKIIACSETVKHFTARQDNISKNKFVVIYNTFDRGKFDSAHLSDIGYLRKEMGIGEENKIIGNIGRLCEQKGQIYLIQAMKDVLKRIPEARLVIIGEGPLKKSLKDQSRALGIESKILFMEKRGDIPQVLHLFDIFALPSLWEGLSVALLEAMYMQKAIVATDIDSNKEAMVSGETGILVPPDDSRALGEAIANLLEDAERRRLFGIKAKERVLRDFMLEKHVAEVQSLYESVLA
jgi:glycosyltransferase involved in cell wall biosynthesis